MLPVSAAASFAAPFCFQCINFSGATIRENLGKLRASRTDYLERQFDHKSLVCSLFEYMQSRIIATICHTILLQMGESLMLVGVVVQIMRRAVHISLQAFGIFSHLWRRIYCLWRGCASFWVSVPFAHIFSICLFFFFFFFFVVFITSSHPCRARARVFCSTYNDRWKLHNPEYYYILLR